MSAHFTAKPRELAPYACDPTVSRGRLFAEPASPTRSEFQRDRDRILHSTAFRRLKHKTQVFVSHEGDHYRTRLTHSLEVSQIARSICRVLGLEEELAETLALAHDLGHTPFGHAGEDAMSAAMAPFGGFDHNAQALRIVTSLEHRYPAFDGLNLTWESLEGLAKHNGPLAEAQVAALSDDIAYNNHDIDDGIRAGLFGIDDLLDVPLVGPVFREVTAEFPQAEPNRIAYEAVRRLISLMIEDLLEETRRNIADAQLTCADDVRRLGRPLVSFSADMQANDKGLKEFLYKNMYRHKAVNRMADDARRVVADLFGAYLDDPSALPDEWRGRTGSEDRAVTARVVADFIAGMTDRYALEEHKRLFNKTLGLE